LPGRVPTGAQAAGGLSRVPSAATLARPTWQEGWKIMSNFSFADFRDASTVAHNCALFVYSARETARAESADTAPLLRKHWEQFTPNADQIGHATLVVASLRHVLNTAPGDVLSACGFTEENAHELAFRIFFEFYDELWQRTFLEWNPLAIEDNWLVARRTMLDFPGFDCEWLAAKLARERSRVGSVLLRAVDRRRVAQDDSPAPPDTQVDRPKAKNRKGGRKPSPFNQELLDFADQKRKENPALTDREIVRRFKQERSSQCTAEAKRRKDKGLKELTNNVLLKTLEDAKRRHPKPVGK